MSQTTRNALAASLKKLLEERPLEKISIRDIIEDSEVNRQTFYYYYKDVYDLIEWIFITEGTKELGEYKSYGSFKEGFLGIFYYLLENQRLVLSAFRSIGREQLERFLYGEVYKLLVCLTNVETETLKGSALDKIFAIDFYKYAIVGAIFEWIRTEMKEDPKLIVIQVEEVISRNMGN